MTSLTAIFGNSQDETSGDTEKLLELYWNRAELKKEFANLREETYTLKDQIKTEQGRTARVQQKYEHLENLLLDPEWVHNVVVFYQLRALNKHCKECLARFAESLKQQREKRQHSRLLEAWNEKRERKARAAEERIDELRMRIQMLEDQLQAERHRFAMMNAIVRFFRKGGIVRTLEGLASEIGEAQEQEQALHALLDDIRSREAPDTQGLTIGDKRSINLMILSYAQQMYVHFADDNVASLIKESGDKSVGAINYGNKSDCDYLLSLIADRADSLFDPTAVADVLQQRAIMLSEAAEFRSDAEAVPKSASVEKLIDFGENGSVRSETVSLLGENYWDLAKIMSR